MMPNYTVEGVGNLLQEHYGLAGKLKELGSYADRNFLLQTEAGPQPSAKYIAKVSLNVEDDRILLLQNEVFRELSHHKHEF
jgi:Ser/Thr protein kinase RdoA (MazF antagonist)